MEQPKKSKIAFLHLPKTGGTSLNEVLKAYYAPHYAAVNVPYEKGTLTEILGARGIKPSDLHAIVGHMPYGFAHEAGETVHYVTMLREPRERVISDYFYIKRSPQHPLSAPINDGSLSLLDYSGSQHAANIMCRRLFATKDNFAKLYDLPADGLDLLEGAKTTLDACAVVGLCERFDDSVALLANRFSWSHIPTTIRWNETPDRPRFEDLSAAERTALSSNTKADQSLYDYARNLFEASTRQTVA